MLKTAKKGEYHSINS